MFLLFFTLRHFHYAPPAPIRHRHFSLRSFPPTAVKTTGQRPSHDVRLPVRHNFRDRNGRSYVTAFAVPLSSLRRPRAPAWKTARRADPHFGPTSAPPSDDRSRARVLPRRSARPPRLKCLSRFPKRNLGVTPHFTRKEKTPLSFLRSSRRHSLKTQAAQGFERYKRIFRAYTSFQ